MLPVEISRDQRDAGHAEVMLHVPSSLFWFRGHFTEQAILPGVAQLDWVMHYGRALLAPGYQFAGIENIKFQYPVQPESTLKLVLQWHGERQVLQFNYVLCSSTPERAASSGKIKLCR
jgi:3-hydroxymyristoyl/3-hydroxydecanoyl-(acyl carrier protein) dehydratase